MIKCHPYRQIGQSVEIQARSGMIQPTPQTNSDVQAIEIAGAIHKTVTAFQRNDSNCGATSSQLQKARALPGSSQPATGGTEYERLALPYVFRPLMSVADASVAVATIFTRIFLGCLLFAVWGTYTMIVWNSIASHFWRTTAMFPLAVLFVFLFGLLMLGISAVASAATRGACSAPRRTL